MAPIKTVGVVSTGVIGSSFVALFLSRGLRVLVCSPSGSSGSEGRLAQYLERIWPTLDPSAMHAEADVSNWEFVGASLDGYYHQVDFIQENAPERLDLKRALLAELDAKAPAGVIIASSSSGMPASKLITGCEHHPERILIGHPYNPPHLIPLVEVVPHPDSDPLVSQQAVDFYQSVGRQTVLIKKEVPGFVANRLQAVLCREAFNLVLNGVCSAEEVDTSMTAALGPRWAVAGPFMTNVMGGGGGQDGFKHLITNMAPAIKVWYDDIDKNNVALDDEKIDRLDESVQDMLETKDMDAFPGQWGKSLVEVLRTTSGDSSLAT